MLSGDETGWLLGDYILVAARPSCLDAPWWPAPWCRRACCAHRSGHGARHVETLTGFKWLARADAGLPGCTLVYAYEEAIGHCVDPAAVRDKDGISAAVLACDLVVALREQGRTVLDALDDLARVTACTPPPRCLAASARPSEATEVMARLRQSPPDRLAGFEVTATDLLLSSGQRRTDALILSGGDGEPRCGWSCGRRAPSQR